MSQLICLQQRIIAKSVMISGSGLTAINVASHEENKRLFKDFELKILNSFVQFTH
jgi:hypothetical protein